MNDKKINIDYVANLARIDLTDVEKEKFSAQLEDILKHFDKISQIDLTGIEASAHAHSMFNVFREDVATEALPVEGVLMNAKASRENQIVVPKVVEDA